MKKRQHLLQQGFTLLELAIVMLLIALILGAIFVGQSLIRSAELRSVIGEVSHYTQAIHDFRDKYRALPGDFPNATTIWGAANGEFSTCTATIGEGKETCNGDGDGRITTNSAISSVTQFEQFRAWQHLANASMIEGVYTGVAGALHPQDAEIGTNVPSSKLTGGGYSILSLFSNELVENQHYFILDYMHFLQLGSDLGAEGPSSLLGPLFTPQEAFSFDSKQDDGLPGSGKMLAAKQSSPFTPDCTNNDEPLLARYDIEQEGSKCNVIFMLGF